MPGVLLDGPLFSHLIKISSMSDIKFIYIPGSILYSLLLSTTISIIMPIQF